MIKHTISEGSSQDNGEPPRRRTNRKGFTLIEILVASTIMGIGLVIALPQLRGFTDTAKLTGSAGQARMLVTAVNIYKMKTGNAISGSPVKPMTITRANTIWTQIASYTANGETIVDTGFSLSSNATFPSGWGETSAGVFDPIP